LSPSKHFEYPNKVGINAKLLYLEVLPVQIYSGKIKQLSRNYP